MSNSIHFENPMQGGSNKGLDVDVGNFFNQGLEEGIKIQTELAKCTRKRG